MPEAAAREPDRFRAAVALRLVSGSDRLRDIMRRTGLADSFDVYRSLTDALGVQPRGYRRVLPALANRPSGAFSRSR
ncbi:hypothetical protein [Streptomyces tendae]